MYSIYRNYNELKGTPIDATSSSKLHLPYLMNTTEWLRCDYDGSRVMAHITGTGSVSDIRIPKQLRFDSITIAKKANGTYTVDFSVNSRERISLSIRATPIEPSYQVTISSNSEDIQGQWYLIGTTRNLYETAFDYRACVVLTVFRHGFAKNAQFYVKQSRNTGNMSYAVNDYPIKFKGTDTFYVTNGDRLLTFISIDKRLLPDMAYKYRIIYIHSNRRSIYFLHLYSADNQEHYVYTDNMSLFIHRREKRLVSRMLSRYFKQLDLADKYTIIPTDTTCYSD